MAQAVSHIAAKDIEYDLKSHNVPIKDENGDTITVTPWMLVRDKEVTKMNHELGLHKINKAKK